MHHKVKRKGMDVCFCAMRSILQTDIPFEKKPTPGFYDKAEEQARYFCSHWLENERKPMIKRLSAGNVNERLKLQKTIPHIRPNSWLRMTPKLESWIKLNTLAGEESWFCQLWSQTRERCQDWSSRWKCQGIGRLVDNASGGLLSDYE